MVSMRISGKEAVAPRRGRTPQRDGSENVKRLLPRAGPEGLAFHGNDTRHAGTGPPACNAPPRGSGHPRRAASGSVDRVSSNATAGPWARRAGRSSDFADTDRSIHLLALASQALRPSACEDVRFRLPLRGSSGFAPDSLLSPTDSRVWTGTDGHNISGRIAVVNPNTWCSGCLAACGSVAPLGRKSNRLAMPA